MRKAGIVFEIAMNSQKVSFVLVVKLFDVKLDLFRLMELNLRAIAIYVDPDLISEILIVASKRDIKMMKNHVGRSIQSLPLRFLDERKVLACLKYSDDGAGGVSWSGWRVQQVIKMNIANFVKSPVYLLLDDDVIATRPIHRGDFCRNGRLAMSYIQYSQFADWFAAARCIFKLSSLPCDPRETVMNVTPQLISRAHMSGMLKEIERLWCVNDACQWLLQASGSDIGPTRSRLLNRLIARITRRRAIKTPLSQATRQACGNWSEYTLYWTYLMKLGIQWEIYSPDEPQIGDSGIWTDKDAASFDAKRWIQDSFGNIHGHCFAVISSKIKVIDRGSLYFEIAGYLEKEASSLITSQM